MGAANDQALWWKVCQQDPKPLPFCSGLGGGVEKKRWNSKGEGSQGIKSTHGNNREGGGLEERPGHSGHARSRTEGKVGSR